MPDWNQNSGGIKEMILPHPESDLSLNLMVLGSAILEKLQKEKKAIFLETLLESFLKKDKKRTPEMFNNALTFLYCFDLIELKDLKLHLKEK